MDGGDQESHQLSCQVEPACPQGEGHSHRVTWAELDLCWQHQQHRREQEALELAKQRARRLLPPRMESGAAARDHLHSQSCARGASLFQLDLLRENPTPAVLAAPSWRVLVPRYLYSDTSACPEGRSQLLFTSGLGAQHTWEKPSSLQGAAGWQQWVLVGLAAQPVLLALLPQTNRHTSAASLPARSEQPLQLSQHSSAPQELSRQAESLWRCWWIVDRCRGCMVCPLNSVTVLISQLQFLYPLVGVK